MIKQLSIFIQNKPGHLAEITELLAENDIDIRAIDVTEGNEFGILRLVTDHPYRAEHVLRDSDYLVNLSDVLAIEPEDKPGSLAGIFRRLKQENIDIRYIYSIIRPIHGQNPTVIIKTSDNEKAKKALSEIGVTVVPSKDVYEANLVTEGEGDIQL